MSDSSNVRQRDTVDLLGGLALIVIGGGFAAVAYRYGIGTIAAIGPGFFPFATGLLMAAIGVVLLVSACFRAGMASEEVSIRPFVFISAAIVAFALLIGRMGFAPATFAAGMLSVYSDPSSRLLPAVVLSVAVTIGCWVIFILLLGLNIPLFRMPF